MCQRCVMSERVSSRSLGCNSSYIQMRWLPCMTWMSRRARWWTYVQLCYLKLAYTVTLTVLSWHHLIHRAVVAPVVDLAVHPF